MRIRLEGSTDAFQHTKHLKEAKPGDLVLFWDRYDRGAMRTGVVVKETYPQQEGAKPCRAVVNLDSGEIHHVREDAIVQVMPFAYVGNASRELA